MFSCFICKELFIASDDVVSTPCGHIFHKLCLHLWFGRSSQTCPQCRLTCTKADVHKIFFNTGHLDASFSELEDLQQNTEELESQYKKNKKIINELEIVADHEANLNLSNKIKEERDKIRASELLVCKLNTRLIKQRTEMLQLNSVQERLKKAEAKLEKIKLVAEVIEMSPDAAEKIINKQTNEKDIALLVKGLKSAFSTSEAKRNELPNSLAAIETVCSEKYVSVEKQKKVLDELQTTNEQQIEEIARLKLIQSANNSKEPRTRSSGSFLPRPSGKGFTALNHLGRFNHRQTMDPNSGVKPPSAKN